MKHETSGETSLSSIVDTPIGFHVFLHEWCRLLANVTETTEAFESYVNKVLDVDDKDLLENRLDHLRPGIKALLTAASKLENLGQASIESTIKAGERFGMTKRQIWEGWQGQ